MSELYGKLSEECDSLGRVTLNTDSRRNLISVSTQTNDNDTKIDTFRILKRVGRERVNRSSVGKHVNKGGNRYISYRERLSNYRKVRNKIFNGENNKSRLEKIKETRNKFRRKKIEMNMLKSAVRKCCALETGYQNDPRAFAEFKIKNLITKGLLDSGASISLLGRNCQDMIDRLGVEIQPVNVTLSTAGGKEHNILGKIHVPVEFKNKIRDFKFYLCPDLIQNVYLGVDFFQEFELLPELFNISEMDIKMLAKDFPIETDELEHHILTKDEENELRKTKEYFRTFEEH